MELLAIGTSMALLMTGSIMAFKVTSFSIYGDLIRKVGSRVQALPLGLSGADSAGWVATATSANTSLLFHLPSVTVPRLASTAGTAFMLLLAALTYNWEMALAMVACIPLCIIALRLLARNMARKHATEEAAMQDLSTRALGFARLQAVLRVTGCLKDRWGPLNRSFTREHETTQRAGQAENPAAFLSHASIMASLLFAVGVAASQVLGGILEPGVFTALSLMAVRFAEPIGILAFYVGPLHEAHAALGDIASIVHTSLLSRTDESQTLVLANPFDLEFDHADFAYADGTLVITDLDQALSGHFITTLADPPGSGKSTLARLIIRSWDVDSGAIRLGESDVREVSNEVLVQRTPMMFQEAYPSDTSIKENVWISCPTASNARLIEAAKRAGLNEVVERPPKGWKTIVGEGGSVLPDGERRRVAIAHVFLRSSPVLLLDEAASALNGVNKVSVTPALTELSTGRSVVVIARHLSTIRQTDHIPVFRGETVETFGSHEEFYEAGSTYRGSWDDRSYIGRWRIRGEEPQVSLWAWGLRGLAQEAPIASAVVSTSSTGFEPTVIGLESRYSIH